MGSCTQMPTTTGFTVITVGETSYTTYCPLTDDNGHPSPSGPPAAPTNRPTLAPADSLGSPTNSATEPSVDAQPQTSILPSHSSFLSSSSSYNPSSISETFEGLAKRTAIPKSYLTLFLVALLF